MDKWSEDQLRRMKVCRVIVDGSSRRWADELAFNLPPLLLSAARRKHQLSELPHFLRTYWRLPT